METELENVNRKLPFETPDGYFDGFEEKMMNRIHAEEVSAERHHVEQLNSHRHRVLRLAISGVAAVALLVIGIYTVIGYQNSVNAQAEQIIAATSDEDAYYDEVNDALDTEEIEEALAQLNFYE
ncbi:MAG: hypothetical protein MJZ93_03210 [Paludibacteraceae bacterium]|nr:hypothetical protein [Paludibacteraceae bacterium]